MNDRVALVAFAALLLGVGAGLAAWVDWRVSAAVFLIIWSNNIIDYLRRTQR